MSLGGPFFNGDNDFFVAKLDASGGHLWSKSFGNNNVTFQDAYDIAVDGSGNAVIVGMFENGLDVGGGALPAPAYRNAFVAKFDGAGQHLWSKSYGASGNYVASANSVASGAGDALFVTGSFEGDVDFGGGALLNPGNANVFSLKLGAGGNHLASQGFGDIAAQIGSAAALDSQGARLLVGTYIGNLDFGSGSLPTIPGGSKGLFVAKLTP